MSSLKDNLLKARKNKQDDFFTSLECVKEELDNYKNYFFNKKIYLNCDDCNSSFFIYFRDNFKSFGLSKLTATCYNVNKHGVKYVINNYDEIVLETELSENGSFNSIECLKELEDCDIVITNPPFSLWREYISIVFQYEKEFIILGSLNSLSYKNVFSMFLKNKIRLGYGKQNELYYFSVPEDYEIRTKYYIVKDGHYLLPVMNCCWYTNIFGLEISNNKKEFEFYDKSPVYNEKTYKKYLNYDAINVDRVKNIPCDYFGIIGVPLTYITVHNSKLFDIIGSNSFNIDDLKEHEELYYKDNNDNICCLKTTGNSLFVELNDNEKINKKYYWDSSGKRYKAPYARLFIKRIKLK